MEQILIANAVLLWVVLLGNLLLTLGLVRHLLLDSGARLPTGARLKAGQRAPDFTAETGQGETVTLASYAGRAVAFLFIGPQCPPCRDALPKYEALGPKAARAGVALVLVSDGDAEQTRAFVDELRVRLPVLVAPRASNPFFSDYRVDGTPSYCLLDAQGVVESAGYPSFDRGGWKDLVAAWDASASQALGPAPSLGR